MKPFRASALRLVRPLLLILLFPLTGAAQVPPESPEVVRPGDVIHIQVWRQPEMSGEFRVTSAGGISHPLYRDVAVAGRPVDEVEEAVRSFLLAYESDPDFVIQPLLRVAIAGEVRQPTVHQLQPGTTITEALAMTGGVTERGRLNDVLLRRDGREYELDLTDVGGAMRNVAVRSGDEIVVLRRQDFLRDYLAPFSSIVGAGYAIVRILTLL